MVMVVTPERRSVLVTPWHVTGQHAEGGGDGVACAFVLLTSQTPFPPVRAFHREMVVVMGEVLTPL